MTESERSQLLQVYSVERQGDQNSAVVVFAIIAAALTYIVASAGFLLGHYTRAGYKQIPSAVLLASPLVTVALLSSLVLTVSANAMRGKHLKKLETVLGVKVDNAFFPSSVRDGADIWEIKRSFSWLRIYATLTLFTYIPIFLIALGYTFAVLIPGPWSWYKALVFSIYCLAIAMQITGLLVASFHQRFKTAFN
jgi:hypothetical protein